MSDDEIKDFVDRAQATQAAVDQVLGENLRRNLEELLERLASAHVFSIAPRLGAIPRPTLAELFTDATADLLERVPPKGRREFLRRLQRLEATVRSELAHAWQQAVEDGKWARANAGANAGLSWAYHLGCLNGLLVSFLRTAPAKREGGR